MGILLVDIFRNIMVNVSMLVLIAYLMTKLKLVQRFVSSDNNTLATKFAMAVIFGGIGIVSTYIGIPVSGAIANTRVIGVMAGGILGGPLVGLLSGLIAGAHRYIIDIGGFAAVSCSASSIVAGLLGGILSPYIKRSRNQWTAIGLVTMLAECVQMGIILLVARPFPQAIALVELISGPMILFNSIGIVLFISIFDSIFIEQNKQAAGRIRLVLRIADQCLPHLRKGLYSREDLAKATQIILDMGDVSGVVITDRSTILSYTGSKLGHLNPDGPLPFIVSQVLAGGQVQMAEESHEDDVFYECLKNKTALCAPLTQKGGEEVIGTLVLFIRKFKLSREVECEFIGGLAKLFSTQLELSQLDYQKKLLRKAELAALQSQINPHFLFNALTTITMFCREKPGRARELLLEMSRYFRNTLQNNRDMISIYEEMQHIHSYVELEKARFEDKLQVEEDIPQGLHCFIPSLILQPLVENSIKHGAKQNAGVGKVAIRAVDMGRETVISVEDNGSGIPEEICRQLYSGNMSGDSVGLSNVHKRLKSIYGEEYGLQIDSSGRGSVVRVRIPNIAEEVPA